VRNTGSVDRPTKNHTARTVPVPVFVSRLLEAEIAVRPADALVFAKAAAVDGCSGCGCTNYAVADPFDAAESTAGDLRVIGNLKVPITGNSR
jgi:hypothetical protein